MQREPSSFRDRSGFVYYENGLIYRQINESYRQQYEKLMRSGLYEKLVSQGRMIEHATIAKADTPREIYAVIQPEYVPFISYPYEWSFGELKDAALATLQIHRQAIDYGMILKDASAYNIQFIKGQPKLIDTLSFDFYQEGSAWVAYGQFCRHFLAPLYLMAYADIRLSQLMRIYIDGIPLDLASKLLHGKGGLGAKQHIVWHSKSIDRHAEDGKISKKRVEVKINNFNFIALIDSLIRAVGKIEVRKVKTEWAEYYKSINYSEVAWSDKERIITRFIKEMNCPSVWDFGANDGHFSRLALQNGARSVVAFDIDPIAVENNYQQAKRNKENILPLVFDLINPSPGIGFANQERLPIILRQHPDCILALALIHHLAISNNLPFENIAAWFSKLSEHLIIEFVPKEDTQVQTLLATREDIFPDYARHHFENALGIYYDIIACETVTNSDRLIYFCRKKASRND